MELGAQLLWLGGKVEVKVAKPPGHLEIFGLISFPNPYFNYTAIHLIQ
jgi:hypothetical protein